MFWGSLGLQRGIRQRLSMGRASERRIARVKSLLISTLAELIREELADPRIGIFSITDMNLASDLATAEVLVAAVGEPQATDDCAKALNGAAPLLWNRLREQTDLRTIPKLRFTADHRGQYSDEVYRLLHDIGPLPEDDPEAAVSSDEESMASFPNGRPDEDPAGGKAED
jgi:ribosome-binding factor A